MALCIGKKLKDISESGFSLLACGEGIGKYLLCPCKVGKVHWENECATMTKILSYLILLCPLLFLLGWIRGTYSISNWQAIC